MRRVVGAGRIQLERFFVSTVVSFGEKTHCPSVIDFGIRHEYNLLSLYYVGLFG